MAPVKKIIASISVAAVEYKNGRQNIQAPILAPSAAAAARRKRESLEVRFRAPELF